MILERSYRSFHRVSGVRRKQPLGPRSVTSVYECSDTCRRRDKNGVTQEGTFSWQTKDVKGAIRVGGCEIALRSVSAVDIHRSPIETHGTISVLLSAPIHVCIQSHVHWRNGQFSYIFLVARKEVSHLKYRNHFLNRHRIKRYAISTVRAAQRLYDWHNLSSLDIKLKKYQIT